MGRECGLCLGIEGRGDMLDIVLVGSIRSFRSFRYREDSEKFVRKV